MAKRLVIDYGTDTLIDLDAPRQNLGQLYNLGGRVELNRGSSAGGYATSALQTKLTSEARNNVDNFVKTWVTDNIDNFKTTQSDDFFKAMTKALKEDLKAFPSKYDTGNFQFDVITKNNLPNVSTFKKGKGFKLFDVGYSVAKTDRLPAMFNKLFFKGKLATDKNLVKDVNNFMEFIVKHKTYGEGGPIAVGKRNAKTLAELSKPEVMSIMEGLGSKAKKEVLESVNPDLYSKFQKKVLGQLQNYKDDLKGLEKVIGQTPGTAWSTMTKNRKTVEKAIGIGGDFAPSVEHIFGVSFAKNSKDPKVIKAALDSVTMIPRKENIGRGFGYYGFDQTRNRLIDSFNTAKVPSAQKNILKELNNLAQKWEAPVKFSAPDKVLKLTPTQSHQSVYKQAKNYVTRLVDNKDFYKSNQFKNLDVKDQKEFLTMKKDKAKIAKFVTSKLGPVLKRIPGKSPLLPVMALNQMMFGRKFDELWGFPLTPARDAEQINELGAMIGDKLNMATGGSVEPRVEYSEGTRMSPAKPKEKTYEELLREIQMEYNIPTDEGYMVKDKLGRLGDIVDVRNYPYYGSKLGKGIMEAAEFSLRFPGAAGQYIYDVATGPGWKEQGLDFIENVSPGWGWSEKVGLDSLIDEQVGNMKKRGSSDAPVSLGGLLELGADVSMPLGYLYGAKKVGQFMKAVGKTPEQVSTLNKRIMDHLDASGQSRRDFITMAGTMGTFAALKAMGLDKVLKIGPAIKGTDNLIPMVKGTSQMPEWFPLFIQKIEPKLIYEGDGISTFKGTDDFLPGMEITKTGDDYLITGKNDYDANWSVSYEGPRWLEIEPGQKPTYFSGEFQVVDEAPYMVGPEDYDWDIVTHDTIDDILGGNGRSMEEFAKGTKIEGLTKGEKQVDWAEGRFQSEMDMAKEEGLDDY